MPERTFPANCLTGEAFGRFKIKEDPLDSEPRTKAPFAASAQNSMAGDHDGQRVASQGLSNGSNASGFIDDCRQGTVGRGGAKREIEQPLPHRQLKSRAPGVEGKREGLAGSGEVFIELCCGFGNDAVAVALL